VTEYRVLVRVTRIDGDLAQLTGDFMGRTFQIEGVPDADVLRPYLTNGEQIQLCITAQELSDLGVYFQ
jgi:hypothetical protein